MQHPEKFTDQLLKAGFTAEQAKTQVTVMAEFADSKTLDQFLLLRQDLKKMNERIDHLSEKVDRLSEKMGLQSDKMNVLSERIINSDRNIILFQNLVRFAIWIVSIEVGLLMAFIQYKSMVGR